MSTTPSEHGGSIQPRRQTEIRCGLVLYGGVSLAVYINGVVREFFEAVRGRGTYAVLKEFLDADIVVDIVSGASAGGVNGVFLGRALATGGDFAASAELWRNKGDFAELLEDPNKSTFENGKGYPPALFKSHAFYELALKDALKTLGKPVAAATGESPSAVTEMDVFVAATDFYGRVWNERDARGSVIEVKDHRAVFHLKHRIDREGENAVVRKSAFVPIGNEKDDNIQEGLARVARITSSFPVAFQPVPFDPEDTKDTRNAFLSRALSYKQGLKKTWFVDGGVLDNKPFSSTLREIYFRSTDSAVDRKVFYVEPDPEKLMSNPDDSERTEPEAESVAIASVMTLPSYESVAGDLDSVKQHNDRVRRFQELSRRLSEDSKPGHDKTAMTVYLRARQAALRDEIVDAIRKDGGVDNLSDLDRWLSEVIGSVFSPDQSRTVGTAFDHLDARLHLRRHFHLVYLAYDVLHGVPGVGTDTGMNEGDSQYVLRYLYAQIERIQAAHNALNALAVRWAKRLAAAASKFKDGTQPSETGVPVFTAFVMAAQRTLALDTQMKDLMASSQPGTNDRATRDRLYDHLRKCAASTGPETVGEPQESASAQPTILTHVQSETDRWIEEHAQKAEKSAEFWKKLKSASEKYLALDVHLFPLRVSSGVHEQDIIDLVRISPGDAGTDLAPEISTYSRLVPSKKKLCGDTFFHFGGFFKRSWRSNDILWGRLDGVDVLISSIVTKESIRRALVGRDLTDVCDRLKTRLLLDDVDANSLGEDLREAKGGQSEVAVKRIAARFIRSAQRRICMEGLPALLEDRIVDRLEWAERDPDAITATRVAATLRTNMQKAYQNRNWTEFDRLAREELVAGPGDEGIDDVSRPKVLRVGLGAGLLIERALRERLGKTRLRWATVWISRLIGLPLRTGYAALTLYERGHTIRAGAMVASFSVFLVTAPLGVYAFISGAKGVGVVASAAAVVSIVVNRVLGFLSRGRKNPTGDKS